MYKVMIVDDEPVIRFGIKASLDWERAGLAVIGDYANGSDALEAMADDPPDILITDIKMPLMGGLELTRKAMGDIPHLKVVLVSSYNDFEYVREGIRLGAVDYILKPTLEPEQLEALMRRCTERLDAEMAEKAELAKSQQFSQEERRRRREAELKRLFIEPDTGMEKLEKAMPDWMTEGYLCICIMLNNLFEIEEEDGYLYRTIMYDEAKEVMVQQADQCLAIMPNETELLVVMPVLAQPEQRLGEIKHELEQQIGRGVTLGYASADEVVHLKRCLEEAEAACRRRFYEGKGSIYAYRESEHAQPLEHKTVEALVRIVEAKSAGSEAMVRSIVDQICLDWIVRLYPEQRVKKEASDILRTLFQSSAEVNVLLERMERIRRAETLREMISTLEAAIPESFEGYMHMKHAGPQSPIDIALPYIDQHYTEELTLQKAADFVHVSKNYFSILFKKHTGQNFIDYVIQLRVNHAKRLLKDSDMKIYEIAECAGFNDVKYFSKLFKKITGVSPLDYREMQKERFG